MEKGIISCGSVKPSCGREATWIMRHRRGFLKGTYIYACDKCISQFLKTARKRGESPIAIRFIQREKVTFS